MNCLHDLCQTNFNTLMTEFCFAKISTGERFHDVSFSILIEEDNLVGLEFTKSYSCRWYVGHGAFIGRRR